MTDVLAKLFGSAARVKLLRLFLFNPEQSFTSLEAAERAQIDATTSRNESALLAQVGLVKRSRRAGQVRYAVDEKFPYLQPLRDLLLNVVTRGEELKEHLAGTGSIKLIIIAGMFVGDWDNVIDLLVVGDRMRESVFRARIHKLEAEIGREIHFALVSSDDFFYRLNMSDKLIRDVFDYRHRILFDKLDIGLK